MVVHSPTLTGLNFLKKDSEGQRPHWANLQPPDCRLGPNGQVFKCSIGMSLRGSMESGIFGHNRQHQGSNRD